MTIADLRREYTLHGLSETEVHPDPIEQFRVWFNQAMTAGVPDANAHRFRDTFSVELLRAGVSIERVSVLLGHQSVRITEKYYAPWVRARQEESNT